MNNTTTKTEIRPMMNSLVSFFKTMRNGGTVNGKVVDVADLTELKECLDYVKASLTHRVMWGHITIEQLQREISVEFCRNSWSNIVIGLLN